MRCEVQRQHISVKEVLHFSIVCMLQRGGQGGQDFDTGARGFASLFLPAVEFRQQKTFG